MTTGGDAASVFPPLRLERVSKLRGKGDHALPERTEAEGAENQIWWLSSKDLFQI